MVETYSLESQEFKNIEHNLNVFFSHFYTSKRKIPEPHSFLGDKQIESKARVFEAFKKDPATNMKRFLHEYDMGLIERDGKFFMTAELTPEIQQYIVYVSKFQCANGSNLKPAYTIQGKNAEAVAMCAINSFLNYFRINNKIQVNTKSFRYGGDGGYDFSLGKYRFDVKHRDDGPNHGLILRDRFLDRAEDDVILIFVTNATNIKLGTGFNKKAFEKPFDQIVAHLKEQVLPMAIVGWMTIAEYKKKRKERGGEDGAWVVDDLNPIIGLFLKIMEDQIESENWFV